MQNTTQVLCNNQRTECHAVPEQGMGTLIVMIVIFVLAGWLLWLMFGE
jgi:hypothetical protein